MDNKKTRKYYRIVVHRYPPYSFVNGSYYMEEDVYAYSEDGALNSFERYHSKGYGNNYAESIREITKEEFRGQHITKHIPNPNEEVTA